jgi:hypothetical protein
MRLDDLKSAINSLVDGERIQIQAFAEMNGFILMLKQDKMDESVM